MAEFCSASANDGVTSTGDAVRSDRDGGYVLTARLTSSTIITVLYDFVCPVTANAAYGGFTIELVMDVSSFVALFTSQRLVLQGAENVATFPLRTTLVGRTMIFVVEDLFLGESVMSMDELLSGSDSSSGKSQKVLVSAGNSSRNG